MPCYISETEGGRMFLCGELGPHCAECMDASGYLCDFPVSDGKTCDRPLCHTHANPVGPDLHYCGGHFLMWKEYKESGGLSRDLANVRNFGKPAALGVAVPDTVREFLEHWSHEGHLQTFEDRERFRKAARELLADGVGAVQVPAEATPDMRRAIALRFAFDPQQEDLDMAAEAWRAALLASGVQGTLKENGNG